MISALMWRGNLDEAVHGLRSERGHAQICPRMTRGIQRARAYRRGDRDRGLRAARAAPASAAELIQDSFQNSTVNNPNYLVGGSAWKPCLTASQLLNQVPIPGCPLGQPSLPADGDPDGDGALRLTSNGNSSAVSSSTRTRCR